MSGHLSAQDRPNLGDTASFPRWWSEAWRVGGCLVRQLSLGFIVCLGGGYRRCFRVGCALYASCCCKEIDSSASLTMSTGKRWTRCCAGFAVLQSFAMCFWRFFPVSGSYSSPVFGRFLHGRPGGMDHCSQFPKHFGLCKALQ